MKISAVQLQSFTGDIALNIAKHLEFIDVAIAQNIDLIFFPELSLTGYEPQLAKSLATDTTDPCLEVFQQRSNRHAITIGVGVPISLGCNVQIATIWFVPQRPRRCYAKQQLHADELPFFTAGNSQLVLETSTYKFAPAICYESLQPSHAKNAANLGADVYLASVAKSAGGLTKAMLQYPTVALNHDMWVIMSNSVGPCDNFISVGQSAVWNNKGKLLLQMSSQSEGFLTVDLVNRQASIHALHTV